MIKNDVEGHIESKRIKVQSKENPQFYNSKNCVNLDSERYLNYFNHFYNSFEEIKPNFENVDDFLEWRSKWKQHLSTCTEFIRQIEFCKEMNKC